MSLDHADLLELKRWNTPSVYNGWEQITHHDTARGCINLESCRDFMPQMGSMVGYAVTVVIEPGNARHLEENENAWSAYRRYVAEARGPKIVIVEDLDKPVAIGSFWGEVNSNIHRALGCVGTITDGAVRDLDEMRNAGFKAIARQLCVGHAYVVPVHWGSIVNVFGCSIKPGQLVHADKHGFLAIPEEDEQRILDACRFMDSNECQTLIATARSSAGTCADEFLDSIDKAANQFNKNVNKKFGGTGEWGIGDRDK